MLAGLLMSPGEANATPEPSQSPPAAQSKVAAVPGGAPFQDDRYRFPHLTIERRVFVDALAMPLAPLSWNLTDWSWASATIAPTVALMLPPKPSLDVRSLRWLEERETAFLDSAMPKVGTIPAALVTVGILGTGWLLSAITQNRTLWEVTSLTTESVALAQFYHLSLKLLLGREGPGQRQGLGVIHGPTTEFFPAGTPSGHITTIASFAGAIAEYYDSWWIRSAAFTAITYSSASLIYHRQHFPSDVIWGASQGYAVARWVVRNRSSRFTYESTGADADASLLPYVTPQSAGLTFIGVF